MTAPPLAFFTLDRGTASSSAALVGPLEGRFRLLAAASQPAALPVEPLLASLVAGVSAADPDLVPDPAGWPSWARLEVAARPAGRAIVAAASERRLAALEMALAGAGWRIAGRISPERTDALAASTLCLAPDVDLVVLGAGEPPSAEERAALGDLAALVAAAVERRGGPAVLLAGAAAAHAARFPNVETVLGPAPGGGPPASPDPLRTLARRLGERLTGAIIGTSGAATGAPGDRHTSFGRTIASLAALLERRVEGVQIGHAAGHRLLADPDGMRGDLLLAEAGLAPSEVLEDDRLADGILRWSTLRGDTSVLRDRVRNLHLQPWRDAAGDGAHLRLAAARAALERLDRSWRLADEPDGLAASYATELLIASGGAFAVAPAPAVALALIDTLRRPGGLALLHDHARALAPLGVIESEADRRRLLADLLDDLLVPLGSAVIVSALRPGRHPGSMRITADGASSEVQMVPGSIQIVDLPPGLTATVDLELRDGAWLGVRARRFAVEVSGGLGGLLIDTRDSPLRLPERPERRRDLLEAWQRPLWTAGER